MAAEFSNTLLNARADQITAARDGGAGSGSIRIYDGVQPAKGGAATTLLAEPVFADPSAPAAVAGVLTANAIVADASADNTGTATWFREVDSVGTFIADRPIADLNLNTTSIVAGQPVAVTSYVTTEGNI